MINIGVSILLVPFPISLFVTVVIRVTLAGLLSCSSSNQLITKLAVPFDVICDILVFVSFISSYEMSKLSGKIKFSLKVNGGAVVSNVGENNKLKLL